MRISTPYLLRSEHGTGERMLPTGWQTHGRSVIGKLVNMHIFPRMGSAFQTNKFKASSMIAVGLNWKMAIGACVLGNFIMGLVITINGRMGAIVSSRESHKSTTRTLMLHSCILHFRCSHACLLATISPSSWSCLASSWLLFGSGQIAYTT